MGSSGLHLLLFITPDCASCAKVKPAAKQACERQQVAFREVDATLDPSEASRYHIHSVPTLVLLRGRKVIGISTRAKTLARITEWLDNLLNI